MKRLRIEHTTGFSYQGDVSASYNEARMLPNSTDSQFVLSSSLDIEPSTSVNQYVDYFGTRGVAAFDVLSPRRGAHDLGALPGRGAAPDPRRTPTSHGIASAPRRTRSIETVEQLGQSARTRPHPEVAEIARAIAAQHDQPGVAAHEISMAIGNAVEYMHGITGVHSTAADAWESRKGVCQDIAHITLGALREVGIPARYVSGYLHPRPDADVGVPVTVSRTRGWSGSPASGRASTRRTTSTSATGTCSSDAVATTTTCPRFVVSTAGPFKSQLHVKVTITREA